MAGLILLGVPIFVGPVLGSVATIALRKKGVSTRPVFYSCMFGIATSIVTIYLYPPGFGDTGKNWNKWLIGSTLTTACITIMAWYSMFYLIYKND